MDWRTKNSGKSTGNNNMESNSRRFTNQRTEGRFKGSSEINNEKGVCFAHQRGECTRGESCHFSHDTEQGGVGGGGGGNSYGQGGGGSSGFSREKRACFAHQRGECTRGESCHFSHDTEQGGVGGGGGGNSYGQGGGGSSGFSREKRACFAHQRGECTRGDSCHFSHDAEQGNVGGVGGKGGGGSSGFSREKRACFAHQRGECTRGESCHFSHDVSGSNNENHRVNEKICYSFQRGECNRGDSCYFSHNNNSNSIPNSKHSSYEEIDDILNTGKYISSKKRESLIKERDSLKEQHFKKNPSINNEDQFPSLSGSKINITNEDDTKEDEDTSCWDTPVTAIYDKPTKKVEKQLKPVLNKSNIDSELSDEILDSYDEYDDYLKDDDDDDDNEYGY